jgi:hypothetical protein
MDRRITVKTIRQGENLIIVHNVSRAILVITVPYIIVAIKSTAIIDQRKLIDVKLDILIC